MLLNLARENSRFIHPINEVKETESKSIDCNSLYQELTESIQGDSNDSIDKLKSNDLPTLLTKQIKDDFINHLELLKSYKSNSETQ